MISYKEYNFLNFYPYMIQEYNELISNKYSEYHNCTNCIDFKIYDYILNKKLKKDRKQKLKKLNNL